jgi:hypothetical protein
MVRRAHSSCAPNNIYCTLSPHKPTTSQYWKYKDELSFILHQFSLVDLFPVFLYPGLPCLKFKMACAVILKKIIA